MIDEIDEVLRKLLIRELPIKNGEVDISFDHPNREWSARISRPTLNLFLYDLRENARLRQAQPAWETERLPDGSAIQIRKPFRVDLQYMITAWASEAEDEHRLLSRSITALFRFPFLPQELLSDGLLEQNKQIPILVGQHHDLQNMFEIWGVLDNEIHPALACTLTISVDPHQPIEIPLVQERELVVGPSRRPTQRRLDLETDGSAFYTIGGRIKADSSKLPGMRLSLVEQGVIIPIHPDGRFILGHMRAGTYILEVAGHDSPARQYTIHVPGADYELLFE
jgi:hypothetical protein